MSKDSDFAFVVAGTLLAGAGALYLLTKKSPVSAPPGGYTPPPLPPYTGGPTSPPVQAPPIFAPPVYTTPQPEPPSSIQPKTPLLAQLGDPYATLYKADKPSGPSSDRILGEDAKIQIETNPGEWYALEVGWSVQNLGGAPGNIALDARFLLDTNLGDQTMLRLRSNEYKDGPLAQYAILDQVRTPVYLLPGEKSQSMIRVLLPVDAMLEKQNNPGGFLFAKPSVNWWVVDLTLYSRDSGKNIANYRIGNWFKLY